MAGLAHGEILVVWEDDDIYLPHHISSHVTAMEGQLWSKPSKVLSLYTGETMEEDPTGRFHASVAMTRQAFDRCGGWPLTMRGDFDQQLLARLTVIGPQGDPCSVAEPGYVFRWGSTGAYHGQALMRGPEDENWYTRVESATCSYVNGGEKPQRLAVRGRRMDLPTFGRLAHRAAVPLQHLGDLAAVYK